jgi:CheY-like chemotaxis protein
MVKKILVVEDQPHNMQLIEQILEDIEEGIKLTQADTGEKALSAAKNNNFDLVLMDIALPDMDGMQLTRMLKSNSQFKSTTFIAVTAYAMLNDEENFKQVFDDYISKPINEDVFLQKVRKWLGENIL